MIQSFISFPELFTGRLHLRELSILDAEAIFVLRSSPEVNQYLDRIPAKTVKDAELFIEQVRQVVAERKGLYWAVTFRDHPALIGTISLFNFEANAPSADIGYELLPPFQGSGYMLEAVQKVLDFGEKTMELKKISACLNKNNERSIALLKRNNFRLTGHEQVEQHDELNDLVLYCRTF